RTVDSPRRVVVMRGFRIHGWRPRRFRGLRVRTHGTPRQERSSRMLSRNVVPVAFAALAAVVAAGFGPNRRGDEVLQALSRSKHTLADGIKQAAKSPAEAISAKFEMEDGKLSLSVYTVAKGLDADAEHNVLQELAGGPDADTWKPETEVFKDVEHV